MMTPTSVGLFVVVSGTRGLQTTTSAVAMSSSRVNGRSAFHDSARI